MSVSGRFLQIVDSYYSPLIQFASSASLWTRIGDIDSVGDPEEYVDALRLNLERMGSVSALSFLGSDGREMAFINSSDGDYEWYITEPGTPESLISARTERSVEYRNLDRGLYTGVAAPTDTRFRISVPYTLPAQDSVGSTVFVSMPDFQIWLDCPISELAAWLEPMDRFADAFIFLRLPGDEYLLFSVDELLRYGRDEGAVPQTRAGVEGFIDEDLVDQIVDRAVYVEPTQHHETEFEYEDRQWRADFRTLQIGIQEIQIGTFIPVDTLWTEGIMAPVQWVVILVFLAAVAIAVMLIRDFLQSSSRITEEERLKQLIAGGESAKLEFKASLRWDIRKEEVNKDLEAVILKSIAAFSNSEGGTLLIGVADNGQALGLENDFRCLKDDGKDYYELHLHNLVVKYYGIEFASSGLTMSFPVLDKKVLCRIDINRGKKPLYTAVAQKGRPGGEKFYIRTGNSSRAIESLAEITEYVVDRFSRRALR